MLIHPALLAVATLLSLAIGRVSGLNPNPVLILAAAGIALVASELAVIPIVFNKSKDPGDVFLKALVGTVLHLGLSVVMGAVGIFALKLGSVFVYWLLGAYWITLIGLCIVFVRLFRPPVENAKVSTN
jgi:hypothetical protein